MDELDKGLDISLHGKFARQAARKVRDTVSSWGLRLPDVEPLVLDFGLGEFEKTGEVEFWIANENEAGYCGKFLFVFPGQTCPKHMHKKKLETFFIVKGKVSMDYAGKERVMETGDVLRVETGIIHSFTGIEPTLLLEVSKPSIIADNYFENTRIPIGGKFRSS
ncbi:MAG: cupin domain-containing protein [Spirochaetales bacterium]|nr:MAG: cupin domain-containing protein [Spirochaetales bacterium]